MSQIMNSFLIRQDITLKVNKPNIKIKYGGVKYPHYNDGLPSFWILRAIYLYDTTILYEVSTKPSENDHVVCMKENTFNIYLKL